MTSRQKEFNTFVCSKFNEQTLSLTGLGGRKPLPPFSLDFPPLPSLAPLPPPPLAQLPGGKERSTKKTSTLLLKGGGIGSPFLNRLTSLFVDK